MLSLVAAIAMAPAAHTFTLGGTDFLLDGKPFQILSGELHPARIPVEYWRHRLKMAKAMGLNTVAAYVFWNYHEVSEGKFDFRTGNHNLAKFLKTAQEEGLWVLLRPGPYVCAEWDFGGIPSYLLRYPDLKVRCMDPRYMKAAERYLRRLATEVKPFLVTQGGPILMVQIENEYGSYGNDRRYLERLERVWRESGVDVPFYTADGPTTYMLEAGSLPGCAVGLDSGSAEDHWELARKMNPGVPVFSSETYPGWLTHWGEDWAHAGVEDVAKEVGWLLDHGKSFNLYVLQGGTNFGFTAGANSGGKGYEPDVTSYDYDAPIDEQGRPTPKYDALRTLLSKGRATPPEPIPATSIPEFELKPYATIWDTLPKPIEDAQPRPMEAYGQDHGLILYRTRLVGHHSGKLIIIEPHDYALVFLDGKYVGDLDRREARFTIDLPEVVGKSPTLDILVEAMGRINYGASMIDRKGITERVTLNGMTLMDWQVYPLSLDTLPRSGRSGAFPSFLKGSFTLDTPQDTFIDTSGLEKGIVWVNGHNLGRYWKIGPQKRLYCPAPFLRKGTNEAVVLDLHTTGSATMRGYPTLRDR